MSRLVKITISAALVVALGVYAVWNVQSDNSKSNKHTTAILECYPKSLTGAEDTPIPNNSIQQVKETSRMFINMPKNLYPKDISRSWVTVSGDATAGYIASAGFPGEAEGALPGCWSTYVDFEGTGEVDLRVKGVASSTPDYFVRFMVSPV